MHELSLAEALLQQVRRHTPDGALPRTVRIEAGPALAIEPMAMQMAWQAVIADAPFNQAALELRVLPWRMRCGDCGREWLSDDPLDDCECGSVATVPDGDGHLSLLSLDVDMVIKADELEPAS
jgi:hydrogenase nickel incorporation protein HypA/HybF